MYFYRATRLGGDPGRICDNVLARLVPLRGCDGDVHPGNSTGEQVGVPHIAGTVTDECELLAAGVAAVLANREQVGEQLAGVEVIAEGVDHRYAGAVGHCFEPGLLIGSPDDRFGHPLEHSGGIGWGLLAAELARRGGEDQRAAAELRDADVEGHSGTGRALVEDDRDRLWPFKRSCREAVLLESDREVKNFTLLLGGDVIITQKVSNHAGPFTDHLHRG